MEEISIQDFYKKLEQESLRYNCKVDPGEYRVKVKQVEVKKSGSGQPQEIDWELMVLHPEYEGCILRKRHFINDLSSCRWQLTSELRTCGIEFSHVKELEDPKRLEPLQNSVLLIKIEDSLVGRLIHFIRLLSRTNPTPK